MLEGSAEPGRWAGRPQGTREAERGETEEGQTASRGLPCARCPPASRAPMPLPGRAATWRQTGSPGSKEAPHGRGEAGPAARPPGLAVAPLGPALPLPSLLLTRSPEWGRRDGALGNGVRRRRNGTKRHPASAPRAMLPLAGTAAFPDRGTAHGRSPIWWERGQVRGLGVKQVAREKTGRL